MPNFVRLYLSWGRGPSNQPASQEAVFHLLSQEGNFLNGNKLLGGNWEKTELLLERGTQVPGGGVHRGQHGQGTPPHPLDGGKAESVNRGGHAHIQLKSRVEAAQHGPGCLSRVQ